MKDGFDLVTDVRSLIATPEIFSLLDGGSIYPEARPAGRRDKCDIVVNCIGINNSQYQKGTPNINIYAPPDDRFPDLPNYEKFNAILKAVQPLVEAQYHPTFNTKITDPGTLLRDADGNWLVSIQLSYQALQDNYKNI